MKKRLLLMSAIVSILLLTFSSLNVYSQDINEEGNKKIVYLTFDDAPGGDTTSKVLDILKNQNVPATFFVIGEQVKGQEDLILRMKNEGHSIGLHSFTHDRSKLYGCSADFINEMKQVQKALYDVTGENYYVLRFPFGCNNSTYRLTKEMVDAIHSNGFKIYDWNQDTSDGANPNSSPTLILNRSISTKDNVVILMHNSKVNKNTSEALTSIIKYYKSQGYTFDKITVDTPEIYHILKK